MNIRANKGLSLIEMIIVLVIFAAVLAIATPSFIIYRQNTNFREAVQDFVSDIALYKQRAMAENLRFQILLDQGNNNYSVQIEDRNNPGNFIDLVPAITRRFDQTSTQVGMMAGTTFAGVPPRIVFQPRGTTTAGTVTLQHAGTLRTATITTNLTGRINVQYTDAG